MKFIKLFETYKKTVNPGDEFNSNDKNDDAIYTCISTGTYNIIFYSSENPDKKLRDSLENFLNTHTKVGEPIITGKQQYQAPTNNDVVEYDFNKAIYLSDEKAIIGAFFITNRTDKYIEILNIKEKARDAGSFMDNARPYTISIHTGRLPLSKIDIIEPVRNAEGFFYIKVPYWLYKENPEIAITRIKGEYRNMKRLSLSDAELSDDVLLKKMTDPNVYKYFEGSNPDDRTLQLIGIYTRKFR